MFNCTGSAIVSAVGGELLHSLSASRDSRVVREAER